MWVRNSEFVDSEIDFGDEEFPEPGGYEVESLCLEEELDRVDRAKDMKQEVKTLFDFTAEIK